MQFLEEFGEDRLLRITGGNVQLNLLSSYSSGEHKFEDVVGVLRNCIVGTLEKISTTLCQLRHHLRLQDSGYPEEKISKIETGASVRNILLRSTVREKLSDDFLLYAYGKTRANRGTCSM
eukprot:scaffold142712_cov14-Tisochrysis_lutea.AAC.1